MHSYSHHYYYKKKHFFLCVDCDMMRKSFTETKIILFWFSALYNIKPLIISIEYDSRTKQK